MQKYIVIAVIVAILFTAIKFALNYKEQPRPDLKETAIVFGSTLTTLYVYDNYIDKAVTPKLSEIFTGPPEF